MKAKITTNDRAVLAKRLSDIAVDGIYEPMAFGDFLDTIDAPVSVMVVRAPYCIWVFCNGNDGEKIFCCDDYADAAEQMFKYYDSNYVQMGSRTEALNAWRDEHRNSDAWAEWNEHEEDDDDNLNY